MPLTPKLRVRAWNWPGPVHCTSLTNGIGSETRLLAHMAANTGLAFDMRSTQSVHTGSPT